jgi:hypothetical protein
MMNQTNKQKRKKELSIGVCFFFVQPIRMGERITRTYTTKKKKKKERYTVQKGEKTKKAKNVLFMFVHNDTRIFNDDEQTNRNHHRGYRVLTIRSL